MKKLISRLLVSGIFTLSLFQNYSYAFDLKDYTIISTRINEKADFRENYQRLKVLIDNVKLKVNQHAKLFKNSNYAQSKRDLEAAVSFLNEAEIAYSIGEREKSKYLVNNSLEKLKDAQLNLMPSRVAEARGLYLDADSIPKNKAEITRLIKQIKVGNFNVIYPEVFRRGYTMFANNITTMDPNFKGIGFDALSYLIQEAHENNIEVHPWVWTFRVKSPDYGDHFLSKYSDLAAVKENPGQYDRETLFLSPSSAQARALIANLLKFLASNYDIDGLLLDYIRFDEMNNEDILSKKYFRQYYIEKYGFEPPYRIDRKDPLFVEWQLWREKQVTEMVKLVKKEINSVKPKIPLGVAIFRTEGEGRLLKMQDWRLWANNHYVDYVCPMLYTNETYNLDWWIDSETDRDTRNDFLYPSLGAHKFAISDDFFQQYGVLRKRMATGVNIFALTHYSKTNFPDLAKGVFRKPAIIPDEKPITSIKAILSDIVVWMNNLKTNEKSLPAKELNNISYEVNKLNRSIPDNNEYRGYVALDKKLIALKESILNYKRVKQFTPFFLAEINEEISYAQKILKIYTREVLAKNKVFTSTFPPLPILPETRALPIADVYPTGVQPNIDGLMESDIWDKMLPLRSFYWHSGAFRSEVETVVKVTYGKEYLYVSFENYEPNIKKTKRISTTKDSRNVLADDSVEVFLKVPGRTQYYHLAINMNNTQFDERVNKSDWNGEWTSGVSIFEDKWIVEFKIPFKDIEYEPSVGESIKANFVRNRFQETDPHSHWSPTYNSPHTPARFGTLVFR